MFAQLAEAIDGLVLSADAAELCDVLALRDRLNAKITLAATECQRAETYRFLGYGSLTAMSKARVGLTNRDARGLSGLAQKLASAKLTADAWFAGTLTEGQVKVLGVIASGRYRERYAANEADIIDAVAGLSTAETLTVAREWKARVDAIDEPPLNDLEPSELYLSPVVDTIEIEGSFDAEAGSVIATAIEQATHKRAELTPAQRRGQALEQICRFYLDHAGRINKKGNARKQRPHLNVSVDLDDLRAGLPGTILGTGLPLGPTALERLLCDANVHRVLRDGTSALLDYGRSVRTAPPNLAQAVIERDGGCRGEDCDRGPEHCEIHHLQPWEEGGATRLDNLGCFCPWDHKKLHRLGITVELAADGTMTFTAPDGRTWQTTPRSRLPQLPFAKPNPPPRPVRRPVIYDE